MTPPVTGTPTPTPKKFSKWIEYLLKACAVIAAAAAVLSIIQARCIPKPLEKEDDPRDYLNAKLVPEKEAIVKFRVRFFDPRRPNEVERKQVQEINIEGYTQNQHYFVRWQIVPLSCNVYKSKTTNTWLFEHKNVCMIAHPESGLVNVIHGGTKPSTWLYINFPPSREILEYLSFVKIEKPDEVSVNIKNKIDNIYVPMLYVLKTYGVNPRNEGKDWKYYRDKDQVSCIDVYLKEYYSGIEFGKIDRIPNFFVENGMTVPTPEAPK